MAFGAAGRLCGIVKDGFKEDLRVSYVPLGRYEEGWRCLGGTGGSAEEGAVLVGEHEVEAFGVGYEVASPQNFVAYVLALGFVSVVIGGVLGGLQGGIIACMADFGVRG